MAAPIRQVDWAEAPLGAGDGLSAALRATVRAALAADAPAAVAVGSPAVLLYNDAYAAVVGAAGSGGAEAAAERAILGEPEAFAQALAEAAAGRFVQRSDVHHRRHGDEGRQDAWFDLTFTPVFGGAGGIDGTLILARDVSARVTKARRQATAEARLQDSEERYRSLADVIGEGYALCELVRDAEGIVRDFRFLEANAAFGQQSGVAREAVAGRLRSEVFPPGDPVWLARYQDVVATDRPAQFESYMPALRGWYRVRAFPRGADRFSILFENISERRDAELAVQESEARLRLVFEALPVGVALLDSAGTAILTNQEMRKFVPGTAIPSRDDERYGRWRGFHPDGSRIEREDFPGARALRGETVHPGEEFLYCMDDGQEVWVRVAAVPLRDPAGAVSGALVLATNIDADKRAADALKITEERFRLIVEGARDYAIFTVDTAGMVESWTAGAQEVFGWSQAEIIGQPFAVTFTPEDVAAGVPGRELAEAASRDSAPDVRWHMRRDGSRAFIEGHTRALRASCGQVQGYLKIGQDMTERRRIRMELEESNARFHQFSEASSSVLWIRNIDTLAWEFLNPAFETVFGESRERALAGDTLAKWAHLVHEDDRASGLAQLARARGGESVTFEYRIVHPSTKEVRWVRDTVFPLRDEQGRVRRVGGIGRDITAEKAFADRLEVLIAELQHRTRNLMTVIRAMADKTLAGSTDLHHFRERFRARLDALTRVNSLLSRLDSGDRITLEALLETELSGHGLTDPAHVSQVTLQGPRGIKLRSSMVQTLALGLHELMTNAIKYGALAIPDGRLTVAWDLVDIGGEQHLRVEWTETGVAVPATVGERRGYGRELIERALPYQLRAKVAYALTGGGVRCTISIPV